ncbi:MAG: ABC transporter permease [Gemmatimonadetes bacterium]|nr:ABC transporter permease [Gemmatimonadota bacterium]
MSRGLLQFLHVAPALGRSFAPDEEGTGGAPVAMLAWHTWQRDFGGRASAIGETVTLDGRSYAIIGVMPRLFDPSVFALIPRAELWLPHLRRAVTTTSRPSASCAPGRRWRRSRAMSPPPRRAWVNATRCARSSP